MSPKAKKSLGQNFLVDTRVRNRIIEAADLRPEDTIIEIGSGRGFLTESLARRTGRLVAVEIDRELVDKLIKALATRPNATVVQADARVVDINSLVPAEENYKMVANLPYYAATSIIRRFLGAANKPIIMVVMVQREVALQMVAEPGNMRGLSVMTQMYGRPKIVTEVLPKSFRPKPKVTSAVVRIDVYKQPVIQAGSLPGFFELVKAGFSGPRKQIRNSLGNGLSISSKKSEAVLRMVEIDPSRRAETLSLQDWGRLYETICQEEEVLIYQPLLEDDLNEGPPAT